MEEIKCYRCKEIKSITEFHRDKYSNSGYKSTCKTCLKPNVDKNNLNKSLKLEKELRLLAEQEYVEMLSNDTNDEIWEDIPKYNGKYQASNLGRIRCTPQVFRSKSKIIKTNYYIVKERHLDTGYKQVTLTNNKGINKVRGVHRWVMFAFHGEREKSIQVNHINGVKDDNRLENLEYMTGVENMHYRKVTNPEDYHCKYRGVFKCRNKGNIQDRVVSCIKVEGVNYYLGSWIDTPENQKIASDTYEKAYDNWYNRGIYPKNVGRQNKTAKALGVGFHKLSGRYRVRYKGEYIGIFDTEELAERIYFLVEYLVESRKVELNKELISKIKKKYTTDRRLVR